MSRSYEEMERLVNQVLSRNGYSDDESRICAREVLDAEWRGKSSYGLELVPHLINWRRMKKADPSVVREGAVHAFIEGGDCAGPIAAAFAMEVALTKVRDQGVALIGVRNKWPWLVAGYHLRHAAEQGFIALTWSAGVSILAPHGGIRPVFGTNPFGYAIPSEKEPIVFDSAMTKGPASILRDSKKNGVPMPEGLALDAEGRPTSDPDAARKGALLPFGGHRGSGLALMIELLGGAWVGAKAGVSHKGTRGFVLLLADPDLFGFGIGFPGVVEALVADMLAAAGSSNGVHIPGRGEVDFRAPRQLDADLVAQLQALAEGS